MIAALPFFHQAGLAGIMNTGLRAGATIVTMPGFEPGQFLDLLERYAVIVATRCLRWRWRSPAIRR